MTQDEYATVPRKPNNAKQSSQQRIIMQLRPEYEKIRSDAVHMAVLGIGDSYIDAIREAVERCQALALGRAALEAADKQGEPVAHMFPSDLERFKTEETFAEAFSVEAGRKLKGDKSGEYTVPVYTTKTAAFPAIRELTDEQIVTAYGNGNCGVVEGCRRVLAEAQSKAQPVQPIDRKAIEVTLPPLDEHLVEILGRPNFSCIDLAVALRADGQKIPYKAENEQAAAIYWMLQNYLKYGPEKWHEECGKELNRIATKGLK